MQVFMSTAYIHELGWERVMMLGGYYLRLSVSKEQSLGTHIGVGVGL